MSLGNRFTEHPATVGETYTEHFSTAMGFAWALFKASICCAVHAILPFCHEKTGSECITGLYDRMVTSRSRIADAEKNAKGISAEPTA